MKTILIIINDAPYGGEKAYNALRIANQLNKDASEVKLRIFLLANAVGCAIKNQNTPSGYYNIERMLRFSLNKGTEVKLCTSCLDARGISSNVLMDEVKIGNMGELTEWIVQSDKVLTF